MVKNMSKNSAPLLCIFLLISYLSHSQKTFWASKVLTFSSEKVVPFQATEYKAIQVLGKPTKLPNYGDSGTAWQPSEIDNPNEDYIKVAFDTTMRVKQIAVAENLGAGCITKIILYDINNVEHEIYQNNSNINPNGNGIGKMFNFILPEITSYVVKSLQLKLNTSRVKGPNQIDAIGISQDSEPVKAFIRVAADAPKKVTKENLGKSVNSRHQEFAPVVSQDGKTIFYTRNYLSLFGKEKDQDVWVTVSDGFGGWEKSKNIGYPINNPEKNAVFAVSTDGREILLMNKYNPSGKLTAGISRSKRTRDGWSFPEEVKIENYYNESPNAEFCISPDGKVMIMSVQRRRTMGKRDLYVSFKNDDDTWCEPKHTGNILNTAEHDVTPFIAADGKTLYFSTRGLPGFGDNDVFKSTRLDDTWQNWTEPENLGSAINTDKWDGFFNFPAAGDYAYICSYNAGGHEDIFRIELPKSAKSDPVVVLSGEVLSTVDKKPVSATLSYVSEGFPKLSERKKFDPESGHFVFVLPLKNVYNFVPYARGYLAITESLDLTREESYKEMRKNFFLMPLEVGQKMVLNSFMFEQGEAKVLPSAYPDLDRIVQAMTDIPSLEVLLEGHTDNQGDFQLNLKLSEDRVEDAKRYLVSKGISPERIQTKGWGQTRPIASNLTEERRKLNRRVEFTITKR
jgi:outer membrane protein OmpA-like peptidoglycan-associated protein